MKHLIARARYRNISIPGEVSVVGLDNWDVMAEQTRPAFTTTDMELKELGRLAGLAILAPSKPQAFSGGARKLPCSIVVRQSSWSACPNCKYSSLMNKAPLILERERRDVGGQCRLVIRSLGDLALRGTMLTENLACPSFGHTQFCGDMIHTGTAASGA